MKNLYVIPIFIPHIGCPNKCVFCNQSRITGQIDKVESKDIIETVEKFLSTIKNKNAAVELAFFGGSFTGIDIEYRQELLETAKKLIDEGKVDYVRISTRPDYIDEDILKTLKIYGVKVIELGVQSMDEEILELSRRGHTAEDVIKASELIKENGFVLGHQMMIGLPGDNYQKSIMTAKELVKLKPDIIRLYPVLVIKDTELEDMYRNGDYNPLSVDEAVAWGKDLLALFEKNNIKVIRVGLQSTDKICEDGDVVAGPYHPSIRELIESSIYYDMIAFGLNQIKHVKEITVLVNPNELSKVIGNRRSNINAIKAKYDINNLKIVPDKEVQAGDILINPLKENIYLSKNHL